MIAKARQPRTGLTFPPERKDRNLGASDTSRHQDLYLSIPSDIVSGESCAYRKEYAKGLKFIRLAVTKAADSTFRPTPKGAVNLGNKAADWSLNREK